MSRNKISRKKKILMLASIFSIILFLSASIAGAVGFSSDSDTDSSGSDSSFDSSDNSDSDDSDSDSEDDSVSDDSDSDSEDDSVSDDSDSDSEDDSSSEDSFSSDSAEQVPNVAPVAKFSSEKNPEVKHGYIFDGSGSYDLDGTIVAYRWSYTVGSSFPILMGEDSTCKHAFYGPGNYLVSLRVTDNRGASDIMSEMIMIPMSPSVEGVEELNSEAELGVEEETPNQPPIAVSKVTPKYTLMSQKLTLDASDSYTTDDDEITGYYWWYRPWHEKGAWYDIAFGGKECMVYEDFAFTKEIMDRHIDENGEYTYKFVIILCVVDERTESGDMYWESYCNRTVVVIPPGFSQSSELTTSTSEEELNDEETVETEEQTTVQSQQSTNATDYSLLHKPISFVGSNANATVNYYHKNSMSFRRAIGLTINSGKMRFGGPLSADFANPGDVVEIEDFVGLIKFDIGGWSDPAEPDDWVIFMLGIGKYEIIPQGQQQSNI